MTYGRPSASSSEGPSISWKCMWEALELPVLPSWAIGSPFFTLSPTFTFIVPLRRWAYMA